jgi:hypothetical protein
MLVSISLLFYAYTLLLLRNDTGDVCDEGNPYIYIYMYTYVYIYVLYLHKPDADYSMLV